MGYSLNEKSATNVDYSEDNIELQKLSEEELKNKSISSYSQDEKAYLLSKCIGKIYICNNGVCNLISKDKIQYLDLNMYKITINKGSTKAYSEHLEECKNTKSKEVYYYNIPKNECNKVSNDSVDTKEFIDTYNKRESELSKIENIGYFLFQTQDEINLTNQLSSSGLLGYGLNLI